MNRAAVAIALVLGALLISAPAQATGETYSHRLDRTNVCVLPDFPVVGSGWRIDDAIADWNAVGANVHLTRYATPDCAPVYVHRYQADDHLCGYTDTFSATVGPDGVTWEYPHADVYLNDNCNANNNSVAQSRWTSAHEIGHALGLWHSDSYRSVMCYCYRVDLYKGHPQPIDARTLAALYATA